MLAQYLTTCNFFWMFCEGLYLHTVVVVAFVSGNKLAHCLLVSSDGVSLHLQWILPPTCIVTI